MPKPSKLITVGVRFDGPLTPRTLQRIGGRLGGGTVAGLINLIKLGGSKQFSLDVGDGLTIEYPATQKAHLRVECSGIPDKAKKSVDKTPPPAQ